MKLLLLKTLLVQTAQTKDLNQVEIYVAMVMLLALIGGAFTLWVKFGPALKFEVTGVQAFEITSEMIDKLGDKTINGVSITKRVSKLNHDVTEALSTENRETLLSVLAEVVESNKEIVKISEAIKESMSEAYEKQADRDNKNHEETITQQQKFIDSLIEKRPGNKRK